MCAVLYSKSSIYLQDPIGPNGRPWWEKIDRSPTAPSTLLPSFREILFNHITNGDRAGAAILTVLVVGLISVATYTMVT